MALLLTFRPIAYPALWLLRAEFDHLSRSDLLARLNAVASDLIEDCGGLDHFIASIEWIDDGDDLTLEQLERKHILLALRTSPTRREAARRLGINDSTLWRKLQGYGLDPDPPTVLDRETVQRAMLEARNVRAAAKVLRVRRETLRDYMKREGITLRSTGKESTS